MTIEALVKQYNYKPLPRDLSAKQRQLYLAELPQEFVLNGNLDCLVYDKLNNLLAYGYSRIVIGDYGAYVEIPLEKMILDKLKVKPGQEYRFEPRYANIKYHWYCLKDNENIKIYYQKKPVLYADYKPETFYISPYELTIKERNNYKDE